MIVRYSENYESACVVVLIVLNEEVSQAKKVVAFGYKRINELV